ASHTYSCTYIYFLYILFEISYIKMEKVMRLATEKGVVIFTKSSCCLCYAVNILFQEIGVYPVIHEIDKDPEGKEMEKAITKLGCNAPVPAVFIGGKLVGSTNEVMSLHLSGSLVPLLRPYQI
ncbi:Monothiol glutaredoxin-S9, partial [Lathyrus oleraceus]